MKALYQPNTRLFQKAEVYKAINNLYCRQINSFIDRDKIYRGTGFIDEIFDYLNFTFRISHKDIKKIPSEGRLIIVANHPIGSLDGLALLNTIASVGPDVKILANDILMLLKIFLNLLFLSGLT